MPLSFAFLLLYLCNFPPPPDHLIPVASTRASVVLVSLELLTRVHVKHRVPSVVSSECILLSLSLASSLQVVCVILFPFVLYSLLTLL